MFPKVLLATEEFDSILHQDLYTFGVNDKIYLIINSKFADITKNYIAVNNLDKRITVLETANCNGSYNTIKSVYDKLPHEQLLFVWSDLLFKIKFQDFDISKNHVFTYDKGNYRYRCKNGSITKVENTYDGNVPGIYYFAETDKYFTTELDAISNHDLIDAIKPYENEFVDTDLVNTIVEYRDLDVYVEKMHNVTTSVANKTRFFNRLEVDRKTWPISLIKTVIDPNYYAILDREFDWYQQIDKLHLNSKIIPAVEKVKIDEHSFRMEYLEGYEQLCEFNEHATEKEFVDVYDRIKTNLEEMQKYTIIVDKDTFYKDLHKELVDKVVDRCEKIKHMLINYDKNLMISRLEQVFTECLESAKTDQIEYSFCHGDLNGSNILVNPTTYDVKFIDPRGYFGDTKLYGWSKYEYAKLLYCLMGYDRFNKYPQVYTVDNPIDIDKKDLIDYLNDPLLKKLVGIIYIALAGYISQDINKANIAYEYGMRILDEK